MGEAKRRAANDPSFGKPKRGVVVSCPIEINGTTLSVKSTSLDAQELRGALLFFDKLAWPTSNIIHIQEDADSAFLISAKVLERPRISLSGSFGAEVMALVQAQALRELDAFDPGTWAIGQGENSVLTNSGNLTERAGVALELLRAVPVPDKDVPLNEVLEFRRKRYDQLHAMRVEIDDLVSSINASDDPKEKLRECVRRIDEMCTDVIKVCSEWKFPVRLSSLKTSLDLKPFAVVRDGLLAYAGTAALGATSALTAALVGATVGASTVSSLKIAGDFGWQGLRDRTNPYRYVASFHKELF